MAELVVRSGKGWLQTGARVENMKSSGEPMHFAQGRFWRRSFLHHETVDARPWIEHSGVVIRDRNKVRTIPWIFPDRSGTKISRNIQTWLTDALETSYSSYRKALSEEAQERWFTVDVSLVCHGTDASLTIFLQHVLIRLRRPVWDELSLNVHRLECARKALHHYLVTERQKISFFVSLLPLSASFRRAEVG
jgi:hypothetical protein